MWAAAVEATEEAADMVEEVGGIKKFSASSNPITNQGPENPSGPFF
jgi:hypothetical protein